MEEQPAKIKLDELTEKDIKYIKWDITKKTMTRSKICQKWNISTQDFFYICSMEWTDEGYK